MELQIKNTIIVAFIFSYSYIYRTSLYLQMILSYCLVSFHFILKQGSLTLGPWTGTGLRPLRNWAVQQKVSSRQASRSPSLPIARITACTIPPPHPPPCWWKNCLPRNQSLVPKRLGTAVLQDSLWHFL